MPPRRSALPVALSLALVACGGDKTVAPAARPFTQGDAQSLLRAITPQMQQSVSTVNVQPGSTAPQSVPCPRGGTVRVSVSRDNGSGAVVTLSHTDCKVDGPDGRTWTVNGDPDLRLGVEAITLPTRPGGEAVVTIAMSGGLRASDGTANGKCAIDTKLQVRATTTPPARAVVRWTGKVCGESVDETVSAAG